MTQGRNEEFVVHAAVTGVGKFEQDTAALGRALESVYSRIRESLASNLGADQIARLREEAAGLQASIAAQKRDVASARAIAATAKAKEDPTQANVAAAKSADIAAQSAEKALRDATAGLATKRRKRIDEEAKVEHEADRLLLEGARTMRQRAAEAVRGAAGALRGARTSDIDAELRREEAAQKKAADKARVDREKADKEAAAQAERDRNKIDPRRIDQLTSRADPNQTYDTSSTGRLAAEQSRRQIALAQADQALLEGKQRALTGVTPQAEMELQLRALAEARLRAGMQLAQTTELLKAAFKEEADAARNTATSANLGPLGRARGNFITGFRGASDIPYMQQAGQAAKFSLLYGAAYKALFAITQTFQTALSEGIQFQQGLSDMAIATGRPKEELGQLAERLAAISADAGGSPSAGLEIGARAQGLYGLAGSKDYAQQDYVAELSTRIVTKMAMGTTVDPVTLQQNIAAVTQALGLGAGGQIRVADLDTYFSKRFGAAPGGTLEAAAQSGSVGIAAGFSLEEIQALAALMIGRTGQSSNAVGGYLAQIFSRGGEGSLQNVSGKYGIDTRQGLAGQFKDLSRVYNASDPNQQAEISAAFGRGKVQNAVVAALQSWNEVATEAQKAREGEAQGSLDTAFVERIGNLGGQINTLMGHFKEFAHLLGESGLLTLLGAGIKVLDLMVQGLNDILSLYNELDPALRAVIASLLTVAAVGKIQGAGGAAAIAGRALPAGIAGRLGLGAAEGGAAAGARGMGAMRALTTGASSIGRLGMAAASAIGPVGWAVGGLLALAEINQSSKDLRNAQEMATEALKQTPNVLAGPGDLRNYGSILDDQARETAKSGNLFKQIYFGEDLDAQARKLRSEADRLRATADELDRQAPDKQPRFAHFDDDTFTAGLDRISQGGGETTQRIRALAQAIDELGTAAAKRKVELINPDTLAGPLAAASVDLGKLKLDAPYKGGIQGFLDNGIKIGPIRLGAKGYAGQDTSVGSGRGSDYASAIEKQLTGGRISERLERAMQDAGVDNYDQLTDAKAKEISEVVGKLTKTDAMGSVENFSKLQKAVNEKIYNAMLAQRKIVMALPQVTGRLNNRELKAYAEQINAAADARMDDQPEADYKGRIQTAQLALRKLRTARSMADNKDLPAIWKALSTARSRLANAQIDQLEALRSVAEQNAGSQGEAARIGMGFVRKEITAAVRSRSADVLRRVIAGAGKGAIAIARDAINDAKRIAEGKAGVDELYGRASKVINAEAVYLQNAINSVTIEDYQPIIPGVKLFAKDKKKKKKKGPGVFDQMLDALETTPYDESIDKEEEGDTPAQIRAARIGARMAKKGGDIAAARAAIAQAHADLVDAEKGTVAYYQALGAMYEARQQLGDALAAYRMNVRSLHIDITDPVAQARLELQEARRKLRRDAGRGRDVKAEDRVAIRQSQVSLEAEKFNQRLSDVQVAEQLGRISHTAYLRYLQNEHNRLSAISKRTRQQQDQLNQIDQLMLDAKKEMQGAWNIGDIKLPTPYEVRRYVKEQAGLGTADRRVSQSTTQVYIDGADVGMVKRVISETVGKNAQVMTVSPRRI